MRREAPGIRPPTRVDPSMPEIPRGLQAHGGERPFAPRLDDRRAMATLPHQLVRFAQAHGSGHRFVRERQHHASDCSGLERGALGESRRLHQQQLGLGRGCTPPQAPAAGGCMVDRHAACGQLDHTPCFATRVLGDLQPGGSSAASAWRWTPGSSTTTASAATASTSEARPASRVASRWGIDRDACRAAPAPGAGLVPRPRPPEVVSGIGIHVPRVAARHLLELVLEPPACALRCLLVLQL
jgi:hypothetical protein